MGLYEVPLSMSVFWDLDNTSQLSYVWNYVVVKSSFKHARESPMFVVVCGFVPYR